MLRRSIKTEWLDLVQPIKGQKYISLNRQHFQALTMTMAASVKINHFSKSIYSTNTMYKTHGWNSIFMGS
jgi:hypothetical protein